MLKQNFDIADLVYSKKIAMDKKRQQLGLDPIIAIKPE